MATAKQKGPAANGGKQKGKQKPTQLPPSPSGPEDNDANEDNGDIPDPRPSRTRTRSAKGIASDDWMERRPYQRSPTKSPQKPTATQRRTQEKRKALNERTNAFSFNDEPPEPAAKKLKLAAGAAIPAKGSSHVSVAHRRPGDSSTSTRPGSRGLETRPQNPDKRTTKRPTANPTSHPQNTDARAAGSRNLHFPGWATPLAGSATNRAALPAAGPSRPIAPLGIPHAAGVQPNPSRTTARGAPPQKNHHVSETVSGRNTSQQEVPTRPLRSEDPRAHPRDARMASVDDNWGRDDEQDVDVDERREGFQAASDGEAGELGNGDDEEFGDEEEEREEEDEEEESEEEESEEEDEESEGEDRQSEEEDRQSEDGEDDQSGSGRPEEETDEEEQEDGMVDIDEDGIDEDGGENGSGQPTRRRDRTRKGQKKEAVVKKASAFGSAVGAAIQMVCRYVRSAAITRYPMASIEEEGKLIRESWPVVMRLKPFRGQDLPWKEAYYPTIKQYFSTVRGKVVGNSRNLLSRFFPFKKDAASKRANCKIYKHAIHDDSYTCEDPENQRGRWCHPLLFEVIQATFFPTRSGDGFLFNSKFFNPITLELIAIVFAAIRCALDEWAKGVYMKLPFKISVYAPVYERHLSNLKTLHRHDPEVVAGFCQEVWEHA
ncbi:hypothetical protein FRC01_000400, partial [Tulasnella sp. 417]